MGNVFNTRLKRLIEQYEELIERKNVIDDLWFNGIYERYKYPVLTRHHTPLFWRYDLNEDANPDLLERMGVNGVFNTGAIELKGKVYLVCRVEGNDRKSFFAVAESKNGIDNFVFWDYPILMPETDNPDVNIYDMRLTKHEDGWIYGVFCTERKDMEHPDDMSAANAQCGIGRTKDLKKWERLDDLKTPSPQQRNAVLHPEFADGKYAFYTRPQEDFLAQAENNRGGIGWGLSDSIEHAEVKEEKIIDENLYHTIKEVKNGAGPTPFKTEKGWLHIAHGVRGTAAGMRYTLYAFLCDLNDPSKVIHKPGGCFIAPMDKERVGDVSNVVFSNGAVAKEDGTVFIYYASSDTRIHVATSSIDRLLDYVVNTPEDPLFVYKCVKQRYDLIDKNLDTIKNSKNPLLRQIKLYS